MSVTDDEVTEAMRVLLKETHNLVEGAGAAPFAAALRDQASLRMVSQLGWLSRVVMFHLRCLSRR